MKNFTPGLLVSTLLSCFVFFQCGSRIDTLETSSPDGKIKVNFFISENGTAGYLINYSDKKVIDTSFIGFEFQDGVSFQRKS